MKHIRIYLLAALSVLAFAIAGCKDEAGFEDSKALLSSETDITIPYPEAEGVVTIFADGYWEADVTDTWITISPKSGTGSVDVTYHVDQNGSDSPRTASIVVKGSSRVDNLTINITQKGDKYKNASTYSLSEAMALEEGTGVKTSACQVMALTNSGFVVSDGSSNMYVVGSTSGLKIGDNVTLSGDIVKLNGFNALSLYDAFVSGSGTASYPTPENITDGFKAYAPGAVTFVTFDGSYSSSKFVVDNVEGGKAEAPLASLGLPALDLHNVTVTGYYIGTANGIHDFVVTEVTDGGLAAQIYLQYEIETSSFQDANNATFGTTYQFDAVKGKGYIKYVPYDLDGTDGNKKFKMDISGKDPRCTGPWPGDYWLFYGEAPIKSGSVVQIQFGARTSATGHKYWILEYLDGKTWKTAGTPKVSTDLPGEQVEYTAAMNADGATNVTINETVTFSRNVEHGQFRFRCVANWQASGAGALAARNGGSARLAVASAQHTAPQPIILMVSEGDGSAPDLLPANIVTSVNHLAFDGTPAGPKSFTITSDQDYTLTPSAGWFSLDVTSGTANQEQTVTVTCDPSELSNLREGEIVILSGETELRIPVVQGAAGQSIEPFISIVGGNTMNIEKDAASYSVGVQSNVEYTATSDAGWLTITKTRALVSVNEMTFDVTENTAVEARTGHITVTDVSGKLVSVLTVVQAGTPAAMCVKWAFSADRMADYADHFGGTAGVADKTAGDGGMYVQANLSGTGTIKYVQVDKTEIDKDGKATRITGGTGHPYVTGQWPGDYWLFTATDGTVYPAGTKLHIYFQTRISATGMRYWMLEYFDGNGWQPAVEPQTATVGDATVSYNIDVSTNSKQNSIVDCTYTLAAPCKDMQFRYRCVANFTGQSKIVTAPNGGTNRIAGADDGTSPIFEVVK